MMKNILIASLVLTTFSVFAQTYHYQPNGGMYFGSNGTTYQQNDGNDIAYGSDGTIGHRIGNTTYLNGPSGNQGICHHVGNVMYCR